MIHQYRDIRHRRQHFVTLDCNFTLCLYSTVWQFNKCADNWQLFAQSILNMVTTTGRCGGARAQFGGISISSQTMCRLFTSWKQQKKKKNSHRQIYGWNWWTAAETCLYAWRTHCVALAGENLAGKFKIESKFGTASSHVVFKLVRPFCVGVDKTCMIFSTQDTSPPKRY